ncbi:hypothetical protein LCGC14_2311640, partial [marine sediment metagenome]
SWEIEDWAVEYEKLEKQIAGLKEWVRHDPACGYGPSQLRQPDGCDCGLTEALSEPPHS